MNDVDILAPSDRWRIRTAQEKAALPAEVDAEGAGGNAAAVAIGAAENVEFIPAGIIEGPVSRALPVAVPAAPEGDPEKGPPSLPGADKTGAIETTLLNGTRLTSSPD